MCAVCPRPPSRQLRVFNLDTFGVTLLGGHTEAILSLDVSPDGRFVATASKDNSIRCVCMCVSVYVCPCGIVLAVGVSLQVCYV